MNPVKWQWEENPMLPVLFFLAGGILCGSLFSQSGLALFSLIFSLAWLFLRLLRGKNLALPRILRSASGFFLLWIAGAGLHVFLDDSGELPGHSAFHAVITEPGELQENGSRRCLARILRIRKFNGEWQELSGQAVLRFPGQAAAGFRSGHTILASIPLRGIPAPAIPGEFNARNWYKSQGVLWQASIPQQKIRILKTGSSPSIRQTAIFLRNCMESVFKKYLPQNGDAAMMSALLLGIRRKMDPELKESYAAAGLTHILAVSGMHVALIYGFLSLLLGSLRKFRGGRFLFSLSITLLLWFYALLTGLSPSVLRAVCLFSIMQFSDVLKKPSLPVNNLCFASIILLLADQNLLFDLGFQLSFSAVFGILSFQPVLSSLWQPRNKILRMMHENLSVTMAASITTLPLILFHFHRFPVYFLFSNLLAVPFSNLLIYGGIALLALSPFSLLAGIAGYLIHLGISMLNAFVTFINGLPFSSIEHLYPTVLASILLIPLIFAFQLFLLSRKLIFAKILLSCTLLLFIVGWIPKQNDDESGLYAIRHKKEWVFLEIAGKHGRYAAMDSMYDEPVFLRNGFRLSSFGKRDLSFKSLNPDKRPSHESRLYRIGGNTVLVLNHFIHGNPPGKRIKIQAILLGRTGEKSLARALHFFEPAEIWLDWNEIRCKNLSEKFPGIPAIRNFRTEKIRQIEHSAGKDRQEGDPESADSRTS